MNSAMKRRTKGILATVVIVFGVGWFLWSAYRGFTDVEYGERFAKVDWLPAEATNVSFYRSYSFTAYEFDIPEKAFLDWASRWDIHPIKQPFEILRYAFNLDKTPYPGLDQREDGGRFDDYARATSEWRARRYATITDGYCCKQVASNGGLLCVAYDKTQGRAYYLRTPR